MKNSKRAGVVSATAATLLVGGVAFAAWTSTGTGTGAVTGGNEVDLTVTQVEAVSGLFPTGSENFEITVTNNNPYAVKVTSLLKTGAGSANLGQCQVSFTELPSLNDFLAPAETPGASRTYTLTASMDENPAEACQGAVFSHLYEATADSAASEADPVEQELPSFGGGIGSDPGLG